MVYNAATTCNDGVYEAMIKYRDDMLAALAGLPYAVLLYSEGVFFSQLEGFFKITNAYASHVV